MSAMGDAMRKRCSSIVSIGGSETESRSRASMSGPRQSYSEGCRGDNGAVGLKAYLFYSIDDIICFQ